MNLERPSPCAHGMKSGALVAALALTVAQSSKLARHEPVAVSGFVFLDDAGVSYVGPGAGNIFLDGFAGIRLSAPSKVRCAQVLPRSGLHPE